MALSTNEIRIQVKEEHLKLLFKKYRAAHNQKNKVLSDANKISLDEEIKQLDLDIETTQNEIDELKLNKKSENDSYRKVSIKWETELYKINYSKIESALNTIFKPLKNQEGAALFLIQKSRSMGGKWCAQKIKHKIQSDLGRAIVSREIGFLSHQNANSVSFLNGLTGFYVIEKIPDQENTRNCVQAIISKIIASLESGQIFLIEINIYTLDPKENFIEWFVNEFWVPLISQLPAISSQKRNIRLIAILAVRGTIPKSCLPPSICCKKTSFNSGKILELPLQKWTETEICNWLFDFSGLPSQVNRLDDDEITQMAKNIHQVTKGLPNDVYHELMEAMTQCAS